MTYQFENMALSVDLTLFFVKGQFPCTSGNITKRLQPEEKTADVEISPGHNLKLPVGEYIHEITSQPDNCTVHISILKGASSEIGTILMNYLNLNFYPIPVSLTQHTCLLLLMHQSHCGLMTIIDLFVVRKKSWRH